MTFLLWKLVAITVGALVGGCLGYAVWFVAVLYWSMRQA